MRLLLFVIALAALANGNEFFVVPDGTPRGDGSKSNPWDLATALKHPSAVAPGDTIWLRGGTYGSGNTGFASKLTGTAERPIVVRQFPGERAAINGGIAVRGPFTWYRDFEIFSSLPDRTERRGAPDGIDAYEGSQGTKFINLVIHDTAQGIGLWEQALDAEVYGCLIYHNGYQGSDRGHGHGIYTQNQTGTKHIADNIVFSQFGWGIHAYGSAKAHVEGYDVAGNIVFNNGELAGTRVDNILIAGGMVMRRIAIENNYTYHTPSLEQGTSRLGWEWGGPNEDIVVKGNYWIGGYSAVELWNWIRPTYTGNTAYSKSLFSMILTVPEGETASTYVWDRNTYYGANLLRYNGANQSKEAWKAERGLDRHSKFLAGRPTGLWAFVRPNRYEPGRANIVAYNWDLKDSINVDVSAVLHPNDRYEVHDAEDFFGPPVAAGVYGGGTISLPMLARAPAAPIGELAGAAPAAGLPHAALAERAKHTAPEFGVWVLLLKN